MLNEKEMALLKIVNSNMLIRREELKIKLNGESGNYEAIITKLVSQGYVNNVDSIGSQCFAITQKGMRALD